MKHLSTIENAIDWLKANTIGTLQTDSRNITQGDAFIAWPGSAIDARQFVQEALDLGACACLVDAADLARFSDASWFNASQVASLHHLKAAVGSIASAFFSHPSRSIHTIAITGTNGKSSVAWWLGSVLPFLAKPPTNRCTVVGTLGIGEPPHVVPNGLTTPDPVLLQASLRSMVNQGVAYCAIEASSIGIEEHRLSGTHITTAVFTNLTQDHLDYHGDLDTYWQSKRKLFAWKGLSNAVVNIDDAKGALLASDLAGTEVHLWTVSMEQPQARLRAHTIEIGIDHTTFTVTETVSDTPGNTLSVQFNTALIGHFNVMNVLCVAAVLRCEGFSLQSIADACQQHLLPVPGRMEQIKSTKGPTVVVDYAHTPDALSKVLRALKPVALANQGQLWCVFGCGGNRDSSKRALMAKAVEHYADHTMVTSDNPRDEDPMNIVQNIVRGFSVGTPYVINTNRPNALWQCITQAGPRDIVLIAGKGHEPYQEIKGKRMVYSDLALAQGICRSLEAPWLSLAALLSALPDATLHSDGPSFAVTGVSTDTRTTQAGNLFIALKGDQFDGHAFVDQAFSKGALVAVVDHLLPNTLIPQIVVTDTKAALGQLASYWRNQFSAPLIAVTGSNGKTTVTQMLAQILHHVHNEQYLATKGNFNNDIGLPLTLLQWQASHQRVVVEMGMNHPGEIAYLARIAQPTVALVNNAQREHLEFMNSVAAVAQENGSVFYSTSATGTAVFPSDEPFTPLWREMAGTRATLTFGFNASADVHALSAQWLNGVWVVHAKTPQEECRYTLAVAGQHNVKNSLAALACSIASGLTASQAAAGLCRFVAVRGRSRSFTVDVCGQQVSIIDDTYNANPDSMRAAVDVLATLPKPSLLVVGDMGEVGNSGPEFHFELGQYAKSKGIDTLVATGQASSQVTRGFDGGTHIENRTDLIRTVVALLPTHASVLVKGSRFMKMEQVVEAIASASTIREVVTHAT